VEIAKQVLGNGRLLNEFVSRLLDDIANLKAMLRAISIGEPTLATQPDDYHHPTDMHNSDSSCPNILSRLLDTSPT